MNLGGLQRLLNRELSHRIKNIFAIVASLIRMSVRRAPDAALFAHDLLARVQSLGRAHEFARPHSEASRPKSRHRTLHGLLHELLTPYEDQSAFEIKIRGTDVPIDEKAATPMALLVHELATNAVKYGALSQHGGKVDLSLSERDKSLELVWQETGGPTIEAPPERQGFGTRLAQLSVEQQMGGTIERLWERAGLIVILRVARGNLVRGGL